MTYEIGGKEFEGDQTLSEVIAELKDKRDFEEFAKDSFKKGSDFEFPNEPYAEALIKELSYSG